MAVQARPGSQQRLREGFCATHGTILAGADHDHLALARLGLTEQVISYGIAIATLAFLLLGFTANYITVLGREIEYVDTIALTVTVFLLRVPTVSETLCRAPDDHPFVTELSSPVLLGFHAGLLLMLIVGLGAQIIHLRKRRKNAATEIR